MYSKKRCFFVVLFLSPNLVVTLDIGLVQIATNQLLFQSICYTLHIQISKVFFQKTNGFFFLAWFFRNCITHNY